MDHDDTQKMVSREKSDRALLEGIHTAVARIEGAMPHMASKADVGALVGHHVEKFHTRKGSLPGGKWTAGGSIAGLIGGILFLILKWAGVF